MMSRKINEATNKGNAVGINEKDSFTPVGTVVQTEKGMKHQ